MVVPVAVERNALAQLRQDEHCHKARGRDRAPVVGPPPAGAQPDAVREQQRAHHAHHTAGQVEHRHVDAVVLQVAREAVKLLPGGARDDQRDAALHRKPLALEPGGGVRGGPGFVEDAEGGFGAHQPLVAKGGRLVDAKDGVVGVDGAVHLRQAKHAAVADDGAAAPLPWPRAQHAFPVRWQQLGVADALRAVLVGALVEHPVVALMHEVVVHLPLHLDRQPLQAGALARGPRSAGAVDELVKVQAVLHGAPLPP
mmetsp:Transcript_30559/g.76452  ORF Transcript_30559/g.76452 Transcript_30559/m.76452 type:complete len:255 (-) Transcript_30559:102-866(-)